MLTALLLPAKSYPPRTENALHGLHQQICAAKTGPHQKLSVLYYLLLDYDEGLSPRSQLAESFARQAGLPKSYQILIKGLWYMDRLQFQVGPASSLRTRPRACSNP